MMVGASFTSFAQESTNDDAKRQEYLNRVIAKEKREEAFKASLSGWRFGGEYSARKFNTIGTRPATKRGLHATVGYRFNKHWYVGGITGIDLTFPFEIKRDGYVDDDINYSIERKDKVYIPIIIEPRYYFNYAKFATYLYVNNGVEFSSSTSGIGTFGLGFDWNIKDTKCVNMAFGLGLGGWESADGDFMAGIGEEENGGYGPTDGFVFSFKIGFSF